MPKEWLRPSINLTYETELDRDGHALRYRDLNCRYMEEHVKQGRRGFVVVSKSKPVEIKVPKYFSTMDVYVGRGNDDSDELPQYGLRAEFIESDSARTSGIGECKVLRYGLPQVETDQANDEKEEGALIIYVLKRLLSNFEVDAIRAAIGDFRSATEVKKKKHAILEQLQGSWFQTVKDLEDMASKEIFPDAHALTATRTIYSPVIREALGNVRKRS